MMKIVHVTESFASGVLSYISQIANAHVTSGFDVTVIYSRREDTPDNFTEYFDDSVHLIETEMIRSISFLRDISSIYKLVQLLNAINPDVVHLHSSKAGVLGRVAKSFVRSKLRIFYSPHGLSFLRQDVSIFTRLMYLAVENIASLLGGTVIASSKSEHLYIKRVIPLAKSVLVTNGVDLSKIPDKLSDVSSLTIGTLNRVTPQKNPVLFASIARRLSSLGCKIIWIGGGDEKFSKLLEDSGIEVFSWMDMDVALKKVSGFDIFLQTSLWEGMPLALIQAQAMGVPAVVSNVVGNKDVVADKETGFLCNTEDEFVSSITSLCSDKALRDSMGKAARQYAREHFSLDRMNMSLADLYIKH